MTTTAPAAERPAITLTTHSGPPRRGLPPLRLRVLVVDDNRDAADSLARLIGDGEYDVRVFYDGTSALAGAAAAPPDATLLDVGLPGIDGYEVARRLRARADTAGALLVAVTGYGQDADVDRALAAGFDHHFVKPIDPNEVLGLLRARGRHPAGAAPAANRSNG